jgi:hypothetical protein
MHKYQKKRLTKIAIHKCLIINGIFWVVARKPGAKRQPQKKKSGSRASTLQTEFYIASIIPVDRRESRKTLALR